jgi:thiol:disulfide interchange protein DsbD
MMKHATPAASFRGPRPLLLTMMVALAAMLPAALWPATALAQEPDAFTKALEQGPLYAGLTAFVGGFLVSLTPCVYPMIAITVSIFGAREAKSRKQAMLLSTCFVAGIVVLFTALLMMSALMGGVFGAFLANKWVIVGLAVMFLLLAASMFGAFEMALPDSVMQRLSSVGGMGYGGAFMLGLVMGLVASPCTGPVLTSIILWIAKTQNVALGSLVGASFAMGLGVPFWLVGTFAVGLPKGGKWMVWVKSFFGIVMLVMALYYLKNAFPVLATFAKNEPRFLLMMAALALVGLGIGAVHVQWDDGGAVPKIRKVLGVALTVVGGFHLWSAAEKPPELDLVALKKESGTLLEWGHDEAQAATAAQTQKRPLIVDFTADWCGACKKMAKETFADAEVMKRCGNFVAVKIDATNDEDPTVKKMMEKYKVVGLPTVVVYDSEGKERKRFNDFVDAKNFLDALADIN